jgi:hypothetical protein
MSSDRIAFNTATSGTFQGDVGQIAGHLEKVIGDRSKAVAAAMADFRADGVDGEYSHVEKRWDSAANEVKNIINLIKKTMVENDGTADNSLTKAKHAVGGIG